MRVEARAPARVDLAGGTLDIPPLDLLVPGACTVNVAIDVAATAQVERIETGIEVHAIDRDIRLRFDDPSGLAADGEAPLLTGLVAHLAGEGGVRLTTDCASPAGAGLGGDFIVLADGEQLWHKLEMGDEFPEEEAILAKLRS